MRNLAVLPLLATLTACGVKTPEGPLADRAESTVSAAADVYDEACDEARDYSSNAVYTAALARLNDAELSRTRAILDAGCFDASEWTCREVGARLRSVAICNERSAAEAPRVTDAMLAEELLWRYGFTADQVARISSAQTTFETVCPQLSYHVLEGGNTYDEGQKQLETRMHGAVAERNVAVAEAGYTPHMAWMCRGVSGGTSRADIEPWLLSPKRD